MAVAGRVAIVPKGDYDAGYPYKRLDMVLYDGNGYVAKKDTTGNLPSDTEYWMKSTEGAVTRVATTTEAGIVKPDGKTITVSQDGTITGASTDFTGTTAEYEAANAAGEIAEGTIVNITDDYAEGGGGGNVSVDGTTIVKEESTNVISIAPEVIQKVNSAAQGNGLTFSVTENNILRVSWEEES